MTSTTWLRITDTIKKRHDAITLFHASFLHSMTPPQYCSTFTHSSIRVIWNHGEKISHSLTTTSDATKYSHQYSVQCKDSYTQSLSGNQPYNYTYRFHV